MEYQTFTDTDSSDEYLFGENIITIGTISVFYRIYNMNLWSKITMDCYSKKLSKKKKICKKVCIYK